MLRPPRVVLLLVFISGCAGDIDNHRFAMPVSRAKRIDVRDATGTPTIFPRRVHVVPGKGSARISSREHDELLRILGVNGPPPPPAAQARLISASGIGPVRLGMTLAEARRALPAATFKRTTDGDGAALVEVTFAPGVSVVLWADEDDPKAPIGWSKTIVTIETFSAAFHTDEGIHPGSAIAGAEKAYGKTKRIQKSEIESREYITFEHQPKYLTFRVSAGRILSIAVSSLTK